MRIFRVVAALAGVSLACVGADAARKSALDKPTLEAYVRHLELLPDNLKVTVGDPAPSIVPDFFEVPVDVDTTQGIYHLRYFVSKDGQKMFKGNLYDINRNPFQRELEKLKTDLQPSYGAPGAPVVIVVFSDFECPNCKEEAKTLRENVEKTFPKEVRVYFKDFPLEIQHPWSRSAAIAGRCVFRQQPAAFWDYHDWIFENQAEINVDNLRSKVLEWAGSKNLDGLQLGRCMDTKATDKEVEKSLTEGRALQINGTPMLFINGRQLGGITEWRTLESVIRRELEYQKKTADAGEKCCEISIPSLVNK